MSLRPILRWPDPRLAQTCAPVGSPEEVAGLIRDLFDTMYDAPGRGLAAPQVGVLFRVFVMDAGWKEDAPSPRACVNPHVLWRSDTDAPGEEGCLSVPGVAAKVTRATALTLAYTDADGIARRETLHGTEARVAQHELDHLDGVMHFDRLDRDARDALLAAYSGP